MREVRLGSKLMYFPNYRLGLGAPLPKSEADGSWKRTELSTNDKLRKQLLGKNAKAGNPSRAPGATKPPNPKYAKTHPAETQKADSESEEESRASLAKKGKKKNFGTVGSVNSENCSGSGAKGGIGKKRPGSYLDEILSKRSKKKATK